MFNLETLHNCRNVNIQYKILELKWTDKYGTYRLLMDIADRYDKVQLPSLTCELMCLFITCYYLNLHDELTTLLWKCTYGCYYRHTVRPIIIIPNESDTICIHQKQTHDKTMLEFNHTWKTYMFLPLITPVEYSESSASFLAVSGEACYLSINYNVWFEFVLFQYSMQCTVGYQIIYPLWIAEVLKMKSECTKIYLQNRL